MSLFHTSFRSQLSSRHHGLCSVKITALLSRWLQFGLKSLSSCLSLQPKPPRTPRKERPLTSAHPKSVPPEEQNLVGYGVDVPAKEGRGKKPFTDNQLATVSNEDIQRWLKRKNRLIKREKRRKVSPNACRVTEQYSHERTKGDSKRNLRCF